MAIGLSKSMKQGHCKQNCPKFDHIDGKCKFTTADDCYFLRLDLNRVTNPRRKARIKIIFEADMERTECIVFKNKIYGAFDGD